MSWSPQQDAAIKAVKTWLKNKNGPQVFRLFGFAGTGKTTLAKHLAEDVTGLVMYACFTGKAAMVLRQKGCADASTIHSLIYKPVEDHVTKEVHFVLNGDSPLCVAALLVVDEVSMVGEDLAKDMLSFGVKILVLGDPEQLPPVKGEGYFINAQPDVMLTEVHRQAADNPIIRLSIDIREGRGIKAGWYGDTWVVPRASVGKDEMREMVLGADQLLCGLNRTRQAFNARVREIKELQGDMRDWHPTSGDRLICLRNDKDHGIFNGSMWSAIETSFSGGPSELLDLRVESLDEDRPPIDVTTPAAFFNGTEKDMDWRARRNADEFTFGWCITVHKGQGSQWPNPLIFDESHVFREDARKWLYTAVTRAAQRVTVVV